MRLREQLEFARRDDGPLVGDLYLPPKGGECPVVVCVHGGGWQLRLPDVYNHWAPWLAARGIGAFVATYRLAAAGRKAYPEAVHDVRAAVQFLRSNSRRLGVDPGRIGLIGDSAGAHLAAMVALAGDSSALKDGNAGLPHGGESTKVQAVVGVYGVYDLWQQWRHDLVARPRNSITEAFLGISAIDDKRPYFEASPLMHVTSSNRQTSFMLAWGDADDVVDHRSQSLPFAEALKQAGNLVRTAPVSGAPHFWFGDPLDEPGSYSSMLAPRLQRFLSTVLQVPNAQR